MQQPHQPTVLIIANNYHHSLANFLAQRGLRVLEQKFQNEADLLRLPNLAQVRGIVTDTRLKVRADFPDYMPNLRWIGRLGSGMEHIDVQALHARGVFCVSTPEGNALAVAEHCLGLYLALLRGIVRANQEVVQDGVWLRNENRGDELASQKVGIIGYGNTGRAFARLLTMLGAQVLAYDKYKLIDRDMDAKVIPATLQEIFAQVDMLSLHLPLTAETHYYADMQFFQRFHKRILFINSSRGQIVDTQALLHAYNQGLLRGVALDVLEHENLAQLDSRMQQLFQELKAKPNLIITPHIAGYTFQSLEKMSTLLCQKLRALALV